METGLLSAFCPIALTLPSITPKVRLPRPLPKTRKMDTCLSLTFSRTAGKEGNNGYRSPYRNLSDASVRAGNHGNLNLTDVASSLTAGGWHSWNPNGGFEPSTTIMAPGPTTFPYMLFLQWDDPFFEDHGITTDYNFLVFDAAGNYQPELSGTSNAFKTTEAYQQTGNLSLGTTYQIAITKSKKTDPLAGPAPATHQLALLTFLDGASQLYGKYFQPAPLTVPNIFGHPAAESAIAVAAYAFNWRPSLPYLPKLDNFTSPGPAIIYFDQNNNRLATAQTRLKPEVAGVDGVLTTFFGAPYYNYPFAFFGTSAAAPTVAGVVALMLQEGGGPASLSLDTVRTALENSAGPRNITPEVTQAIGSVSGGIVSVTALAQSYFGPSYLTLNYFGPAGQSIDTLTICGLPSRVFVSIRGPFCVFCPFWWLFFIGYSRAPRSAQNRTPLVTPNTTTAIPISHQKIDWKALLASFSVSAAGTVTICAPTISPDCQPNPFALP